MKSEYIPYVSYSSYGVDATDFYSDFGVSITAASRATGVSRKSASRVSIGFASKQNTEKIIQYLEDVSANDINQAISKFEEAWNDYEKRENILNTYCQKHNISRKIAMVNKMSGSVLECVKAT